MKIREHRGFTLVELLVVVAIIGILAAIAIPQYAQFRQKGFDAIANTDLRNAATAEEAYFATERAYKSCNSVSACEAALPGFFRGARNGVTMAMTSQPSSFTGTATHNKGTGKTFSWNSAAGGIVN